MTATDPASLQNLHDIVHPAPVPFWPPAPGWYAILIIVLAFFVFLIFRIVRHYRRNAYRRAALRELAAATTCLEVAEILKRTALATYPREEIAGRTGSAWTKWLSQTSGLTIPATAGDTLTQAIYNKTVDVDMAPLTHTAALWIRRHRRGTPC